jgi:hypothetical protein
MTAVELVRNLQARGIELAPAGDRVRFRPGDAVTAEERDALRAHKVEVLALLVGPSPASTDPAAVALRVAAFRDQLRTWQSNGQSSAPVLRLPDLPAVTRGHCVGCGEALADGRTWRCAACVAALETVLGLPPLRLDQETSR